MKRFFEVARKMEDKKIVINPDTNEPVLWDVSDDDMPEYATKNAAGADFKAVNDTVIPSIWRKAGNVLVESGCLATNWVTSMIKHEGLSDMKFTDEMKKVAKKTMAPTIVHTGIKAYMPEDEVLYIYNRSSGPKKLGIILANSVGVIDSDYYGNESTDGEIMFAYYNILPFDITITKGTAIGQGVFHKFLRAENSKVGGNRTGGFGSTDTK